jgi:NAD(P)-dependent dehydrogenase (short-subunit alcohol dehydrogenase family)
MDQKTVLITGSTRGIGLKFAELYKQRGWKVIGAARDVSQAEQVGSQHFCTHLLTLPAWRLSHSSGLISCFLLTPLLAESAGAVQDRAARLE